MSNSFNSVSHSYNSFNSACHSYNSKYADFFFQRSGFGLFSPDVDPKEIVHNFCLKIYYEESMFSEENFQNFRVFRTILTFVLKDYNLFCCSSCSPDFIKIYAYEIIFKGHFVIH